MDKVPVLFRSSTSMPAVFKRAVLASDEDTAPGMSRLRAASRSMKKFTVEPVPTPSVSPGTTYFRAASAALRLASSWLIGSPKFCRSGFSRDYVEVKQGSRLKPLLHV